MLSVQEAAELLGVSGARVRALLKNGQLEGKKIGNTWAIAESSVVKRASAGSRPGRPVVTQNQEFERSIPDIDEAHRIYEDAKRVLSGCYDAGFLNQARSSEEQAFWVRSADFFLQQKQHELVRAGVY